MNEASSEADAIKRSPQPNIRYSWMTHAER